MVLQDAGTAPGTTATSAGKTRRPSVSSAPTPSASLTRRGRCAPLLSRDSCAVRSTTSWRSPPAKVRMRDLKGTLRARPAPSAVLKAPRPKPRAPRGKPSDLCRAGGTNRPLCWLTNQTNAYLTSAWCQNRITVHPHQGNADVSQAPPGYPSSFRAFFSGLFARLIGNRRSCASSSSLLQSLSNAGSTIFYFLGL